ncbi:M23 family metallopeptidase [Candidatus Roizmanbacteria bacterium]|nr:M23 family metallopeptidase [Candidatus Roizmanbacteria bacterium]
MLTTFTRMFRSYNGRHFTSRWARKFFDRARARQLLGYNLAVVTLVASIVEPTTHAVVTQQAVQTVAVEEVSELTVPIKTETTLSWPVASPFITQGYRFGHWGIDIQDRISKDIHPVDQGWVSDTIEWNFGYGKHVIVQHPNGRSSLYGHLNAITVSKGQEVTRETILGEMGRTGWATGIHLHLELFQDGKAINPLSILPVLPTE